MSQENDKFTKNLEDFSEFKNSHKHSIIRFLKNNFKENKHYN